MRHAAEMLTPRILIVDDERQIHASLRLRLGAHYEIVSCLDPQEALRRVQSERFDLCIVDIHMPQMDGLKFVETAQPYDPALGFVVLTAFDTDDNLRRAIPLQVYDLLSKPLPAPAGFERRMPDWIERTRQRRHELGLAQSATTLAHDLDSAILERDVEFVASESARDALLQTAGLLTTIHAHLVTATSTMAARARQDSTLAHLLRSLDEARKTADAAVAVAEGFFDSAYGNRDASPALVKAALAHAGQIASRIAKAELANKSLHLPEMDEHLAVRGLSGIDFLLLLVPALALGLAVAGPHTTVGVRVETLPRLEAASKDPRYRSCIWLNRKTAWHSQPGMMIVITAAGPALGRAEAEAWLKGEHSQLGTITARGLVRGIEKCRGVAGISLAPEAESFHLLLVLPV